MNENRKFGWIPKHDTRSLNYPIRELIGSSVKIKPKMWKEGVVLDQGTEGACVGFGWTAELLAQPVAPRIQPKTIVADSFARQVYREAQKIDEWPGENYSGTSVLAGAKIIQSRGFMDSYRWCFGINDIRDTLITTGPVVLGVPWYFSMYYTNLNGLVTVDPLSPNVGGHCILLTGYAPSMKFGRNSYEVYRWRNSWGKKYGKGGSGFIKAADLDFLIKQSGEACVPINRKLVKF